MSANCECSAAALESEQVNMLAETPRDVWDALLDGSEQTAANSTAAVAVGSPPSAQTAGAATASSAADEKSAASIKPLAVQPTSPKSAANAGAAPVSGLSAAFATRGRSTTLATPTSPTAAASGAPTAAPAPSASAAPAKKAGEHKVAHSVDDAQLGAFARQASAANLAQKENAESARARKRLYLSRWQARLFSGAPLLSDG